MAEPHDRKPILTIEQQIEHLKQKGVAFELCSEEEAADYLRDKCNFFKLASYRKLFSKYEGGPRDGRYVDLDFGQLRLLAALDQELRHALLGMTLDIEHFQKVTLLREMEDRGEDGYAIVADYMASLTTANREYRLRELKMSGRSPYSSSLYAKYSGDMPAWAFLELTSFGTLIDFVRFCARRWGDRRPRGHLQAIFELLGWGRRRKKIGQNRSHDPAPQTRGFLTGSIIPGFSVLSLTQVSSVSYSE